MWVFLPEIQLSIFVQLIQILFEYMHPTVLANFLSNRNVKNGHLKSVRVNSKFRIHPFRLGYNLGISMRSGPWVMTSIAVNFDLLRVGIRLQYLDFFWVEYFAYTLESTRDLSYK